MSPTELFFSMTFINAKIYKIAKYTNINEYPKKTCSSNMKGMLNSPLPTTAPPNLHSTLCFLREYHYVGVLPFAGLRYTFETPSFQRHNTTLYIIGVKPRTQVSFKLNNDGLGKANVELLE